VLERVDFRTSFEFFWFWTFLSSYLPFCVALPLFLSFAYFYGFPSSKWPSWAFHCVLVFYLCFMGFWIWTSNFVPFVANVLIKGKIKKPSGQLLGLFVMSHWLIEIWIQICDISIGLPFSLFCLDNRVCLSRGVHVTDATWRVATRIMIGIGDLVQRTENGRTCRILDGQTIERSGDTVCDLHRVHGDEEHMFLGWASKPRSTIYQWFD
jgi:hypothetical protein